MRKSIKTLLSITGILVLLSGVVYLLSSDTDWIGNENAVVGSNTITNTPMPSPTPDMDIEIEDSQSNAWSPIPSIPVKTSLPANTIIDTSNLGDFTMNQYFNASEINSDIEKRILGKSYKANENIAISDLQYLTVIYYGFDEKTHIGEIIVNRKIANKVLEIFKELYEAKYPIEKMTLIDEYEADDNASMADNNTSAFCYRTIDGMTKMSKHSLGIAIDINPLYNPYVRTRNGKQEILPVEGLDYADRSNLKPYMMDRDDLCVQTFLKHGFTWGGDWKNSKDYQHFEIELENK